MENRQGSWDIISGTATLTFIGFIVAILIAFFYPTTEYFGPIGWKITYPFRQYLFPLGFGAGLFLLIAIGSTLVSFQTERDSRFIRKKCLQCGKETYNTSYAYCPYCGTAFQDKTASNQ